jgi:hypothetical protein
VNLVVDCAVGPVEELVGVGRRLAVHVVFALVQPWVRLQKVTCVSRMSIATMVVFLCHIFVEFAIRNWILKTYDKIICCVNTL